MSIASQLDLVSNDSYHANTSYLGNSALADFIESSRLYEGRYVIPEGQPGHIERMSTTKPMEIGDTIHGALLEGKPLRSTVAIYNARNELTAAVKGITKSSREAMTQGDKSRICSAAGISIATFDSYTVLKRLKEDLLPRMPKQHVDSRGAVTPEGKAFAESKMREGYKYCVKRSDYDQMQLAVNVLRNSPVWKLIENEKTVCEQTITWTNELGMLCKCRPDFLIPLADRTLIFDLKVTEHHTPKKWRKQVENNARNKTQPIHYIDGAMHEYGKPVEWRWVTLNPKPPFTPASVCVHRLNGESLEKCEKFYSRHLNRFHLASQAGDWSEYYEAKEVEIELSNYAFN